MIRENALVLLRLNFLLRLNLLSASLFLFLHSRQLWKQKLLTWVPQIFSTHIQWATGVAEFRKQKQQQWSQKMTDLCPGSAGLRSLLSPFPAVSETSTCEEGERLVRPDMDTHAAPTAHTGGTGFACIWGCVATEGPTVVSTGLQEWGTRRDITLLSNLSCENEKRWRKHLLISKKSMGGGVCTCLSVTPFKTWLDSISSEYPAKFFLPPPPMCVPSSSDN